MSKTKKKTSDFNYMILPLMAYSLIPIIIRVYIIKDRLIQFQWYGTEGHNLDEYFWGKCIAMYIIAGIMALMMLFAGMNDLLDFSKFEFPKEKKKLFTRWYILLVISFILSFASSLFSKYISFSFGYGTMDNRQNIWTLLCYAFVPLYAFLVISKEKDLKLLQWPLFIMEVIVIAVGYAQTKGVNIEALPYITNFIFPAKLNGAVLPSAVASTTCSATFGNPNYVGVFAALCIPISVSLIFANRNIFAKLLWLLDSLGLIYLDYLAHNKTSVFALAITFAFCVFVLLKKNIKLSAIKTVLIVLTTALIIIGIAFVFKDKLINIARSLTSEGSQKTLVADDLSFEKDGVHITYEGTEAIIGYDVVDGDLKPWIKDGNGNYIETYKDDNGYTRTDVEGYQIYSLHFYVFNEEAYEDSDVPYAAALLVNIPRQGGEILFVYHSIDQTYYYVTPSLKLATDNKPVPTWIFANNLNFASGRGLVWGKTLPILPRYLILGAGADCFAMGYPNNDYAYRWRLGAGEVNYVETKAHSLYFQAWVEQGGLSLFCWLAVFVIYIIDGMRIYSKPTKNKFLYYFGFGLLLGTVSYLVMGITNDSKVGPATLFWLLLGIGFAVNRLVKLEQESN